MKNKYTGIIMVFAAMCALSGCEKEASVVPAAKTAPPAMVDETPKQQTPAQNAALGQYKLPTPEKHKYHNPKF